jgi:hypothetical protein
MISMGDLISSSPVAQRFFQALPPLTLLNARMDRIEHDGNMSCAAADHRLSSRLGRRQLLVFGLAGSLYGAHAAGNQVPALLRQGGVVVVLRHALAPGTFDPPQFELGNCSTQRLLSEEGRSQARRIGSWFSTQQLWPRQVRSSPWCRCIDTATLAFGQARTWPALGSPYGRSAADKTLAQQELREALAEVPAGSFDVWVTHSFVIDALLGASVASGAGFVVRRAPDGSPLVLESLSL